MEGNLKAKPPRGGRPSDTAAPCPCSPTVELMRTSDLRRIPASHAERGSGPSPVRIRAIRPSDARELERFYATLTEESRRTRFFGFASGLSHSQSVSFCTTDHDHREGFVAVVDGDPAGQDRIVGHLCLEPDGADAAEVAIAVADEFQHRGIGRRLMTIGAAWARREGITRFTATMLASNAPIHRLLVGLGLSAQVRPVGGGVAAITIDLGDQRAAA